MNKLKCIALDCDGVLLDYNEAYGRLLKEFFGKEIPVFDPTCYHAENYYGIANKWVNKEERAAFFKLFNEKGWAMMQALPGALQATQQLKDMGYYIYVVTSMDKKAQEMRFNNLKQLGFPIDEVISTGKKHGHQNPKKEYIEHIKPEYFVDDLISNFHNITSNTHFVLIDLPATDSPNLDFKEPINLHSKYNSLLDFVKFMNQSK